MRQLIVDWIMYLYNRDKNPGRWNYAWFDKEFKQHYKPSLKEIQKNNLIFITDLDWRKVPDNMLVEIFEYVVHRSYAQFG